MLLFMIILSSLYIQKINCYGVETVYNEDNTNTLSYNTSEPKDNLLFILERSTLKFTKGNESDSNLIKLNEKVKRETITDPLEEFSSGNMSNIQKVSDVKINYSQMSSLKQAEAEESPYSVMLFAMTKKGIVSCTGTLLTLEWVLSAASCLWKEPFNAVIIYAGGNAHEEWLNHTLAEGSQMRYSYEYHYHPDYYTSGLFKVFYNVLLIKADSAFSLSKTVAPIELSTSHLSFAHSTNCKITSFGRMDLPMASKNYFRKTQHLSVETPCLCFNEENSEYWICPKHSQPLSICTGDIGAGLICDGRVKAFLSYIVPGRDVRSCDMSYPNYYDCFTINNTINVFQGTCPYLRFINQYVNLFSSKQIQKSCDLEPQDITSTSEKPYARSSNIPCCTLLNMLIVLVLICLTN